MGILSTLGLNRPRVWPPVAVTKGGPAPVAKAKTAANGKPVGPVVNETNLPSLGAGPIVDEQNIALPRRSKTIAGIDGASDEAASPPAETASPALSAADSVPITRKVTADGLTLGVKESDDGLSLIVKVEEKQNVGRQNFKVWVIPCYIKADLKLGLDGELKFGDKTTWSVKAKAAGSLELGVGGSSDVVTAGPFGAVELSASSVVPSSLSEARAIAIKPFVVDIYGTGKVGIKVEIKQGPTYASEAELVKWHLFVVHVGACTNGSLGPVRVEQGKDMKRLVAALQNAGPAIADAVEKYAPESVKKLAEDGARWIAEDRKSKQIADATQVVLDELKNKTGVDIGAGVEKSIRFLVDPGGETSNEATERVRQEMVAFNASYDDYKTVMAASGLDSEFPAPLYRTSAEYNAIVDVWASEAESVAKGGSAAGAWRPMAEALVARCRARKAELEAAEAAKNMKARSEADAAAAAELARRIKQSEEQMNAALKAANNVGNPLDHRTQATPQARARQFWKTGMIKFWQPGSAARLQVPKLQGEARIAKANEATALLVKAAAVFQEGLHVVE